MYSLARICTAFVLIVLIIEYNFIAYYPVLSLCTHFLFVLLFTIPHHSPYAYYLLIMFYSDHTKSMAYSSVTIPL